MVLFCITASTRTGVELMNLPTTEATAESYRGIDLWPSAQILSAIVAAQGAAVAAVEAAVPVLSQLLKAEVAEREVRSIAYQIKAARFPAYKDLAGYDFASSEVNEALVRQLHRGEFMDGADNVVLIGGPGTGKTHIAKRSASRPSNITARRPGSSPRSIWSMHWSRKRP